MTMFSRDSIVTCGFCLAIGGVILQQCHGFPETSGQGFGSGPAFYPEVLAWLLMGLGLLSLRAKPGQADDCAPAQKKPARPRYGLVALILGLSVAYIFIQDLLGFFPAAAILVLAMAWAVTPPKSPARILAYLVYTAGLLLVVYLVFELFVGIQLPCSSVWA
ncbi:tripartite tricarboxylate transporter TctB family protein [Dethiosulfatarculus sandiegensis]|uniref:DUF1468 domain-containing protein n=1 Tax=Dethiosulfatarculus sandiegensis TaxID=1429043 RepID=A0A0D2HWX8_9BACT|nr:tripartite tricarboxylate transporter TctB family protein [Dethiosulfatarculus sandiegensis]KIX14873.1 hypothetical protein X474_06925 [Dethiosulfatarculus sandiegensis]